MKEYIYKNEIYTVAVILFKILKNLRKDFSKIGCKEAKKYQFNNKIYLFQEN